MLIKEESDDARTLEGLIDQYGMVGILAAVFDICHAKAAHLRDTWQDDAAAKEWERGAEVIDHAISKWP